MTIKYSAGKNKEPAMITIDENINGIEEKSPRQHFQSKMTKSAVINL
jgi:hypothetical protein